MIEEPDGFVVAEDEEAAPAWAPDRRAPRVPRPPPVGSWRRSRRTAAAPVGRLLRARRRSAADLDGVEAAQGARRAADRLGVALRPGDEQPYPSAVFSGSAEILTTDIGPSTAAIMQRIAAMPEAPADRRRARGRRPRHPGDHGRASRSGELHRHGDGDGMTPRRSRTQQTVGAGCMVGVPRVVRELNLGSGAKDPQSRPVEGS